MDIIKVINLNMFAQDLIELQSILSVFNSFEIDKKRSFLEYLVMIIIQSKPCFDDIEITISESKLKPTYTPCVLLKKGIEKHNLLQIVKLPEYELNKVLILLLHLFKIAYLRGFAIEKNDINKWWYWDFSDESNNLKLEKMKKEYEKNVKK